MPLVADLRLTSNEQNNWRPYFQNCSVWKAFKVVEIELSFLYDVLHTKAVLINGLRGCLWRFLSLVMIFSAFVLFLKSDKRGYAKTDIIISYVLFGSALFMELISLFLIIFSDWMIFTLELKEHSLLKNLAVLIAKVMSCFFSESKPQWSHSMDQYSFMSFSLRDKKTIIKRFLGDIKLKRLWDKLFSFTLFLCQPKEEVRVALMDLHLDMDDNTLNLEHTTWSVLSDARRLAKELNDMWEEDKRWLVISKVWVEMLGYAAINCKTYNHAKQLSQGGEFLTHVYLLMFQMCI
ncbi:uncharacterized protein LOC144548847 [Carex rostrata]